MLNVAITDINLVVAFWLCFSRWLPIMIQLPLFDGAPMPVQVKVLSTLVITYAFFPYLEKELLLDIAYMGGENFWLLTIFNVVIGLAIGFFVKSIMMMFTAAGSVITQQIGFGAVRYFDVNAGQQVGPFEKIIGYSLLIIVLTSGALIPMMKGVFTSFSSIHIYDVGKMANASLFFTRTFKGIFLSSLLLSSPLIFTNMLIMTVLGIVARTVPQMNVLMVSFVINIGLGLLVFITSSEEFFQVAFKLYTDKLGEWFQFIT